MDHSLYKPLPLPPPSAESGPSIRLLKLGDTDCQLEVVSLRKCPEYKALSYCWGDTANTLPLRCNGHDLQVTTNLHSALEHLRSEYGGQLFWIDAVCINQEDKAEQGRQVSIMRDIYSQAEEVLIWLGPSTFHKSIAHVFTACERYANRMRGYVQLLTAAGMKNADSICNKSIDLALTPPRPFTGADVDGLIQILRQPYWTRLWVIQEMCVAKTARIHAGQHSVPWEDFKLVLVMMERCLPWVLRDMGPNFRALIEFRSFYDEEDQMSRPRLADLLVQFRWSRAKVPMDKVYGLLGLAPESDRDLVRIDYKMSPAECYTRVMFGLLRQSGDLSLLMDCNAPSFVRRELVLPSWVPDWSYDASHLPPPRLGLTEDNPYHRLSDTKRGIYKGYRASGNSECPVPLLRDGPGGPVLTLHGMITGRVSEVSHALELRHLHFRKENYKGNLEPVPPVSRHEYVRQHWGRLIWNVLTNQSIATILLFPMNCYRKGAALNILLQSARLAQSPGTRLGEDGDDLKVFFTTLIKGRRGCEYIQDRIVTRFRGGPVQEMVTEFQKLQTSLRWNPLLKLMTLVGITRLFPFVYLWFLGFSYEHHRGSFHLGGVFIALLHLIAVLWRNYVPIPSFLLDLLMVYGFYTSLRGFNAPAWPKRLDFVLSNFLEYALGRTEDGRLALVPHNTRVGDEIALLKGSNCPFVVRSGNSQWTLIGDSYVHGTMEGEEWQEQACVSMEFV